MKNSLLLGFAIVLIASACCKKNCPTHKSKEAAPTSSTESNSMDAQLTAVKLRFPDATREELQKGHSIYTGACTNCHGAKDVTVYTEEKLLSIVDVMAPKAKITAEEKQALIRFAVGVRATSK